MKEYIEREALKEQIRLMASRSSLGETKPDSLSGIEVVGLILEAPAADVVERKRGEWDFQPPDKHGNSKPICPHCKTYKLTTWADWRRCNFCPNCGADMREGDHEADKKG